MDGISKDQQWLLRRFEGHVEKYDGLGCVGDDDSDCNAYVKVDPANLLPRFAKAVLDLESTWSPVVRLLLQIWNHSETSMVIAIIGPAYPRVGGMEAVLASGEIMRLVLLVIDVASVCLGRLVDDESDVAPRGQKGYAVVGDALLGRDVVPVFVTGAIDYLG